MCANCGEPAVKHEFPRWPRYAVADCNYGHLYWRDADGKLFDKAMAVQFAHEHNADVSRGRARLSNRFRVFALTPETVGSAPSLISLSQSARAVQNHVPVQPWSHRGDRPSPLEIGFDLDEAEPWFVRYVKGVRGTQRRWGGRRGRTLAQALDRAREDQRSAD